MRRRDFLTLAGAAATVPAWPLAGLTQGLAKVPRVALVTGAIAIDQMQIGRDVNYSALLDQMAIDGFVEGKTVTYDRYRLASMTGSNEDKARQILAGRPDVIFWGGASVVALPALPLDRTTPMVAMTTDLLAEGYVMSLTHPEANVTGISVSTGPDFEAKELEVLARAVPGAKSVVYTSAMGSDGQIEPNRLPFLQSAERASSALGLRFVTILYALGGGEAEFAAVFDKAKAANADMILFGRENSLTATAQQALIAKMAIAAGLPTLYSDGGYATQGGLLSYGPNYPTMARRVSDYIAAILKGTKVGDLPGLQPTDFDLVVNLKTAKAIGVTIPASLLAQATEVIQ